MIAGPTPELSLLGCLAGLATSGLWTATTLFATAASRRIGPLAVNTTRILVAIVLLAITHRLLAGVWIPELRAAQVGMLAVSGLIGLTLGDQALFAAFLLIGPRLALLLMTSAPIWAALIGWIVLGERIAPQALVGMAMTLAGIGWVITERSAAAPVAARTGRGRGVVLALVAALFQAVGLLLSKQGIGHGWLPPADHLAPQSAALVRMTFAGVGLLPLWLILRSRPVYRPATHGSAALGGYGLALGGAFFGPFLGMWMSLEASHRVPIGVAQTLASLPPVLILPLQHWVYDERVTIRAVAGALLAVLGIGVLVLAR